mmetsp:Transcript_51985/g.121854  ORF Transcript_51985/g.121854 Transcript_51985/m.121854 type:complete len:279 (-) Transcript_51985:163-999(-)
MRSWFLLGRSWNDSVDRCHGFDFLDRFGVEVATTGTEARVQDPQPTHNIHCLFLWSHDLSEERVHRRRRPTDLFRKDRVDRVPVEAVMAISVLFPEHLDGEKELFDGRRVCRVEYEVLIRTGGRHLISNVEEFEEIYGSVAINIRHFKVILHTVEHIYTLVPWPILDGSGSELFQLETIASFRVKRRKVSLYGSQRLDNEVLKSRDDLVLGSGFFLLLSHRDKNCRISSKRRRLGNETTQKQHQIASEGQRRDIAREDLRYDLAFGGGNWEHLREEAM